MTSQSVWVLIVKLLLFLNVVALLECLVAWQVMIDHNEHWIKARQSPPNLDHPDRDTEIRTIPIIPYERKY